MPDAVKDINPLSSFTDRQRVQGLSALNHADISLFGKVVDQDLRPVANAKVTASIIINDGISESTKAVTSHTDGSGRFKLEGYKGRSVGINISKDGYKFLATNTLFVFSHMWPVAERHVPDSVNPVVFRMWKSQPAEELIQIDEQFKVHPNQGVILIDLVRGKVSPDYGDLKFTVVRSPGTLSKRSPGDWSLDIEAIRGGGILRVPFDVYRTALEAPDTGYEPAWRLTMRSDDTDWFDNFRETFFVKSGGGAAYSKFILSFHINKEEAEPVTLSIRGVVNARSSRNLEPSTQ